MNPLAALKAQPWGRCVRYGVPQAYGYREQWTPARSVRSPQVCHFCWSVLSKASPGTTTGTRGTKAYYEPNLRLWECLACAAERSRVEAFHVVQADSGQRDGM